jgi:hypothetical protein
MSVSSTRPPGSRILLFLFFLNIAVVWLQSMMESISRLSATATWRRTYREYYTLMTMWVMVFLFHVHRHALVLVLGQWLHPMIVLFTNKKNETGLENDPMLILIPCIRCHFGCKYFILYFKAKQWLNRPQLGKDCFLAHFWWAIAMTWRPSSLLWSIVIVVCRRPVSKARFVPAGLFQWNLVWGYLWAIRRPFFDFRDLTYFVASRWPSWKSDLPFKS